jgi:hypothetical protein
MNNAPQLARAVLIPMDGDQPDPDENNHILVQFNPETLKVTLSNSLKADNQGGNNNSAAQYVDKSESSLAVELLFDTTVARDVDSTQSETDGGLSNSAALQQANTHEANSDVRALTKKIADTFMQPQNPEADRPGAPTRCRFQWGAFVFVGMLSSYNETLEYFSPEGIPLRAKLALSFKEDRYQFEQLQVAAAQRAQPTFSPSSDNLAQTLADQKQDPKKWRDAALFNGIENPRLGLSLSVSLPTVSVQASAGLSASLSAGAAVGFNSGASASLGTSVPGAFVEVKPPKVDIAAGTNVSAGVSASIGGPQAGIRIRS